MKKEMESERGSYSDRCNGKRQDRGPERQIENGHSDRSRRKREEPKAGLCRSEGKAMSLKQVLFGQVKKEKAKSSLKAGLIRTGQEGKRRDGV